MAKRRRTFELPQEPGPKHVLIQPPPATLLPSALEPFSGPPPWEDMYKDAEQQRRGLEREKRELADFGSQVCSLCLGLAKMLQDEGKAGPDGTVTIPKALHEQMVGAGITVGTDKQGNPFVKIKERGRERIAPVQ